jgi:hypothetical protein
MGEYTNTNDHAVRVRDDEGNLRRLAPGAVIAAEGDFEKRVKSVDGLESATDEHRDAYRAQLADVSNEDPTPDQAVSEAVSGARAAVTRAQVVEPLQRIVGDDDAPFGPPTGTITTKSAIMEETKPGDPERNAFADHERLPSELGENASEVEVAQAEVSEQIEEIRQSIDPGEAEGRGDDPKASTARKQAKKSSRKKG